MYVYRACRRLRHGIWMCTLSPPSGSPWRSPSDPSVSNRSLYIHIRYHKIYHNRGVPCSRNRLCIPIYIWTQSAVLAARPWSTTTPCTAGGWWGSCARVAIEPILYLCEISRIVWLCFFRDSHWQADGYYIDIYK